MKMVKNNNINNNNNNNNNNKSIEKLENEILILMLYEDIYQ